MRQAREEDLEIIAVYHSHPETPARPSVEDIKLAYDPNVSYVIVSLADNKEDIKSFLIRDSKVDKTPSIPKKDKFPEKQSICFCALPKKLTKLAPILTA